LLAYPPTAGEYVFTLQQVAKQYNGVTVLNDVTLAFFLGAPESA
jgi:hypothetical protein